METKQVKTKSGITGWQGRLQDQYDSLKSFIGYDETYALAAKLGFLTPTEAWDANPIVQGSVIPEDYCRVLEPDDLPVTIQVIVELSVNANKDGTLAEWEVRHAAEQAVEHAVKVGEEQGHHDFTDKLSLTPILVDANEFPLESTDDLHGPCGHSKFTIVTFDNRPPVG